MIKLKSNGDAELSPLKQRIGSSHDRLVIHSELLHVTVPLPFVVLLSNEASIPVTSLNAATLTCLRLLKPPKHAPSPIKMLSALALPSTSTTTSPPSPPLTIHPALDGFSILDLLSSYRASWSLEEWHWGHEHIQSHPISYCRVMDETG